MARIQDIFHNFLSMILVYMIKRCLISGHIGQEKEMKCHSHESERFFHFLSRS